MNFYPHHWLGLLRPLRKCFDKTQVASSNQVQYSETTASVRCAQCRTIITQSDSAMEMAGAHQHILTNPAGVRFTVVVYRDARCDVIGLPSAEHTWFTGYVWQVALCAQCGIHLGWCYSHAQIPDFYGLIASHLSFDTC